MISAARLRRLEDRQRHQAWSREACWMAGRHLNDPEGAPAGLRQLARLFRSAMIGMEMTAGHPDPRSMASALAEQNGIVLTTVEASVIWAANRAPGETGHA